jgi:glycerophosphoryl diester phosphodiesterase
MRTVRWLIVLLLAGQACPCWTQAPHAVQLHGHRGARGLAPENTLAAFRRALAVGVDVLELDVGMSADGVPMVSHDSRLNPALARDAQGRWVDEPGPLLRALDLRELQRYDVGRLRPGSRYAAGFAQQQPVDGERIPTLAQVLALGRQPGAQHVRFNIETKLSPLDPGATASVAAMTDALLAEIDRAGMAERCIVQSFDWRTLARVRHRAPAIPTAALTAEQSWLNNVADPRWTAGLALADHGGSVPRLVHALGAQIWSPHHADLTPERLAEARALGLQVVVWTVNAGPDIDRMLDWGVDGIISDHPQRVRALLARRGLPLAPEVVVAP